MRYDVAIIGAGLSGLAAGVRLAHFDRKVCLLERHYRVGGLNSYYARHGRPFDVGLHALTNFAPPGVKNTPWPRLLRQLRIGRDEIPLRPQVGSEIRFPEKTLKFTNDFGFFEEQVVSRFPHQADAFARMKAEIAACNELDLDLPPRSARAALSEIFSDPLLVDMILCPLMFYGSAVEDDMDFGQFVIMFKSIFMEGLSRPVGGVRPLLDLLVRKFEDAGGELRLQTGVAAVRPPAAEGQPARVILENGAPVEADCVLSCAGYPETLRLCGETDEEHIAGETGRLAYIEALCVLDRRPTQLDIDSTIVFFSNHERFAYRRPDEAVDFDSGVLCMPNNFQGEDDLGDGMVRITHLANYDAWDRLDATAYSDAKKQTLRRAVRGAERWLAPFGDHVVATDLFTPRTVERFTGRFNGAIYGSPNKRRHGRTPYPGVYLCGADQGFLGIVGAMLSGITMANNHIIYRT